MRRVDCSGARQARTTGAESSSSTVAIIFDRAILWIKKCRPRYGARNRLGDLLFRQLAPDVGPPRLIAPGWLRCVLHITINLCRSLKPAMKQDAEGGGAVHALIADTPFVDVRRKLVGYAQGDQRVPPGRGPAPLTLGVWRCRTMFCEC